MTRGMIDGYRQIRPVFPNQPLGSSQSLQLRTLDIHINKCRLEFRQAMIQGHTFDTEFAPLRKDACRPVIPAKMHVRPATVNSFRIGQDSLGDPMALIR